jgi:hypothetical protein
MNIINQTNFQRFEDISLNIKPERLSIFINKAQELDLKPFLGYALYYDLIKNLNEDGTLKEDAPQPYKDLVNGTEYLDKRGYVVLYQGLAPLLVYFTFARFIEDDAVHYTATGPVIKQREGSSLITPADITKLVQQQRSTANAYANETERFLRDHQADFSMWAYNPKNKSARQAGPRIRGIDKTEFNYQTSDDAVNYLLPFIP